MSGINFDDRESFMYFEKMIRDKGIIQKMRDAGIQDGDSVILYDLEFDFVD
jgi:GTP-binding protein